MKTADSSVRYVQESRRLSTKGPLGKAWHESWKQALSPYFRGSGQLRRIEVSVTLTANLREYAWQGSMVEICSWPLRSKQLTQNQLGRKVQGWTNQRCHPRSSQDGQSIHIPGERGVSIARSLRASERAKRTKISGA